MGLIDSPHVIKMHEFMKTPNNYYIVQEFANGGSLQDLLEIHQRSPELIAKKFL